MRATAYPTITEPATVISLKRLSNTVNGNGRWNVTVHIAGVRVVFRTKPDANAIARFTGGMVGQTYLFHLDSRGRIEFLEDVAPSGS